MGADWTGSQIRILLQLLGRIAIPEDKLRRLLLGGQRQNTKASKYLRAYNLADGTLSQSQLAKQVGLDQGNLSRAVTKWIAAGIMFAEPMGKELKLQNLYPVLIEESKKTTE